MSNHKCNIVMYGNYFKFEEFVVTQCNDDNTPSSSNHLSNLACLWDTLNQVREKFGQPIVINSAYRTPSVNKQVGGAKRSLHMEGRAADIRPELITSFSLSVLWDVLQEFEWKELIQYPTFIHVAI